MYFMSSSYVSTTVAAGGAGAGAAGAGGRPSGKNGTPLGIIIAMPATPILPGQATAPGTAGGGGIGGGGRRTAGTGKTPRPTPIGNTPGIAGAGAAGAGLYGWKRGPAAPPPRPGAPFILPGGTAAGRVQQKEVAALTNLRRVTIWVI